MAQTEDERAIRGLIATWLAATKRGDLAKVLTLMADDVVFMVPGREPFGKQEFAASSEQMKDVAFDGESEIRELSVLGDWAYCRTHLRVTVTPANGKPVVRSGYTLTILRRERGAWVIARDANLLTPEK